MFPRAECRGRLDRRRVRTRSTTTTRTITMTSTTSPMSSGVEIPPELELPVEAEAWVSAYVVLVTARLSVITNPSPAGSVSDST